MWAKAYSAAVWGVDAIRVDVEASASGGEFSMVLVGLPDAAVRESKDRVKSAIENSGFGFPYQRLTLSLAPADLKKAGPSFDLPLAITLLAMSGQIQSTVLESCWIVGELALSGEVRPIRGALPIALAAKRAGCRCLVLPRENAAEAAVVKGVKVIPIHHLRQAVDFLEGRIKITPQVGDPDSLLGGGEEWEVDFSEVKGQESAKRALEIAVSGGHNILLQGDPGCGKSMLAKRIPTIFPPFSLDEALETTKIHSVAGVLKKTDALVCVRPFRSPHHTISDVGLIGGSSHPSPGEVSLAHNGVLFLDELPEFNRNTLEVLRQPLEDGLVTITRAAGSVTFPSRFMLVAAMNPTPTGSSGDVARGRVSGAAATRYLNRISGPLMDRIDIHLEVPPVKHEYLLKAPEGEPSSKIRERVILARERQRSRFVGRRGIYCNAQMSARMLMEFCKVKESALELIRSAMQSLNLSARAYDRILKVARTIADVEQSDEIQDNHVAEAVQYRSLDRQAW